MISDTKLTVMTYPQYWDGSILTVNLLVLPHEDPLSPFAVNLPAGINAPAFADANLKFRAMIIDNLDMMPRPMDVIHQIATPVTPPVNARALFVELSKSFKITKPSNVVTPANAGTFIQKYLPKSYRNSFAFSSPRTPLAKTDDSYLCSFKKKDDALPPPVYWDGTVSWGKVFSYALRQPALAKKLGFIYYEIPVPIPAGAYQNGGWLYFDLDSTSDFYPQKIARPAITKHYAARIPALSTARPVYAAVHFPVSDTPVAGNYDPIFIEAEEYDDGFAKIVHCMQPVSANLLLEPGQENQGLRPTRDFGIRLGWDDEQILIWQNRQMAVDPEVGDRLDAPMGVFNYRVDVRKTGDDDANWNSLEKVTGDLTLNGIDVGNFTGELGIEVGPSQLDGQKDGPYWLPSYYTQWTGTSLVLKDQKAATLGGTDNVLKKMMQPVDDDKVALQYGDSYDFRVRFGDITGGGPHPKDVAINSAPPPFASCRFRRLLPPKKLGVPDLKNGPAITPDKTSCDIYRSLLGYPALLYTGLPNAYNLLLADLPSAMAEQREASYPDPDVTMFTIDVDIKAPEMDNALSDSGDEAYYHLFTTQRNFPDDITQPFHLEVAFHDVKTVKYGDAADLGDLPLTTDTSPLQLPTARNIRIRVTPLCKADPTLKYFGSQEARIGQPVTLYTRAEASDERALFKAAISAKQFQCIMLQPDPAPSLNTDAVQRIAGLGTTTPANLFQRLAEQLELDTSGLSLFGKPGQRVIFGCAKGIRHTLSPEHASITFASKADLTHQWIATIIVDINRDWAWDGLAMESFDIKRDGVDKVGFVEFQNTVGITALKDADRSYTRIIFFDAIDPKEFGGVFPKPEDIKYTITTNFQKDPAQQDTDKNVMLTVPVAIPPAQVPKIVSAGIALTPYEKSDDYSSTNDRRKVLWIEFAEPVENPTDDDYFAFVKSYSPDPILLTGQQPISDPKDNIPFLPAELIRVITQDQSDDQAGLNAWQRLLPCKEMSPRHFIIPLPPGLNLDSKELFGFFTYQFCVGHARVWSTAQGRFGRPITITGIQHPAPSIRCITTRDESGVSMTADFATPVFNGRNLLGNPQTELWGVLYAQVSQANGMENRNILLTRRQMYMKRDNYLKKQITEANASCGWSNDEIAMMLVNFGLPKETSLSVVAIEMYKNFEAVIEPLGENLGKMRIYRTSRLVKVPMICCCED